MQNKVCLITGASDGLGLEVACQLAKDNIELILVGRDNQKLVDAKQIIFLKTGNAKATTITADLSLQKDINKLGQRIHDHFEKIDILINNAGGVFSKFSLTEDGLEKTIATNHFSYFILTQALLKLLKKSPSGKIINVASNSHFQGAIDFESFINNKNYNIFKAYSQSKLANLLFTYQLAEQLKDTNIIVNAISPGRVRTKIGNKSQAWYISLIWTLLTKVHSYSVAQSAQVYVYLATHPDVSTISGKYFNQHLSSIPSSPLSYNKELARELWLQTESLIN